MHYKVLNRTELELHEEKKSSKHQLNHPSSLNPQIFEQDIIAKNPFNPTGFTVNNWRKQETEENKILNMLEERGGALWLTPSGLYTIRYSREGEARQLEKPKMQTALCSFLNTGTVNLSASGNDESGIQDNELLLCFDTYNPFIPSEFYLKEGNYYRNTFRPSKLMQITEKPTNYREPETILWLIEHLSGYNDTYYKWILNWLSYFFQHGEKSQVALILLGSQGTGKGILMNKIITPLLGQSNCVVVDNDRISTRFKGWVEGKLFYNLNEISANKQNSKEVKNFIKALITENTIMMEEKYKDAREVALYGNVLITTNEKHPTDIEPSDRRFTVIPTGEALSVVQNFDYDKFVKQIGEELENFAWYLKNHPSDKQLYNTALSTPAKDAIIANVTDRKFIHFFEAITHKDISYFTPLKSIDMELYTRLHNDFEKNRICQSDITPLYNTLYSENISSNLLLNKLRTRDPFMFPTDRKKLKKSNGKYYYILPSGTDT